MTEPKRKAELLKTAHLSPMHGSWRALLDELHLRKVYWRNKNNDSMFTVKKREAFQLREWNATEDEVPPKCTGTRAVD